MRRVASLMIAGVAIAGSLVPVARAVGPSWNSTPVPTLAFAVQQGGQSSARPRRPVTRKTASATFAAKKVELNYGLPTTSGPEFQELGTLKPGSVVRLFSAPALRLRIDLPLYFGDTELPIGNVAANYPGIYSVWLRRAASGWELVFNDQGDVWGTQYDGAADRLVVPLQHALDAEAKEQREQLKIDIEAEGSMGTFDFWWGEHRWTARFATTR